MSKNLLLHINVHVDLVGGVIHEIHITMDTIIIRYFYAVLLDPRVYLCVREAFFGSRQPARSFRVCENCVFWNVRFVTNFGRLALSAAPASRLELEFI